MSDEGYVYGGDDEESTTRQGDFELGEKAFDLPPTGSAGMLRMLDLGVVDVALLSDGPVQVYTGRDREVLLSMAVAAGATPTDVQNSAIVVIAGQSSPLGSDAFNSQPSIEVGSVGASLSSSPALGPSQMWAFITAEGNPFLGEWQADTEYHTGAAVLANGTLWYNSGEDGTSGSSEPDWAANAGDHVLDGPDIDWTDLAYGLPTEGSANVYATVSVPAPA